MKKIESHNSSEALVSIIIRTKNEEKWISSCLRSVYSQSYKNIEVIIVDNNSTDKTVVKAQVFPVKVVNIEDFLPGKAINLGIRKSTGKYIVCLSGHCVPVNNDWLANLVEDLNSPNIAGIYGKQEPLSFTSDIDKRDLMMVFGNDKKIQVKDSFFHNANSAFKRSVWDKYPFDENVTNIEDRIWGELVISQGLNIIYEPSASVYHWHGIHQDLNPERAKNIVRILESLESFQSTDSYQKSDKLKILAIIPLRGVMNNMNDRPLFERTINSALQSKLITKTVVAADNKEIASIAEEMGADTPFIRPKELSEDYINIFDVVEYAIEFLELQKDYYDIVVLLEETYPFREEGMIDNMINELITHGYDTVIPGKSENRDIWLKQSNNVEMVGRHEGVSMPGLLRDSKNIISLIGLCCVTHVASIRNDIVFSGNLGIVEIHDSLTTISARSSEEIEVAGFIEEGKIRNEK